MADVHLPHLDDEHEIAHHEAPQSPKPSSRARWKPLLKIGLEIVLIATGVSLGLAGEQWRENRHHRELAEASLHRFRAEFVANRGEVLRVKGRHDQELKNLLAYITANQTALLAHRVDQTKPIPMPVPETVTDSAGVDFAAWDFALATQSLAYLDPDLVASMSSVYRLQQVYLESHRSIQQASYAIPNLDIWLNGVATYFGDASLYEELLLKQYDRILPRLDAALGHAG